MSSSGVKEGGEEIEKKNMINPYLNSVMAPPKTLRLNGVLLVEDVEAPKTEGLLEERLRKLEEDTHRYRIIIERSLGAHFLMSRDPEKKFEAYEERIKDLEEKYLHTLGQPDRFRALMWDIENQNCKYEDCFQKIAEAALTKWKDPSMSFYNGRPYPWKLKEWDAYNEEKYASEEELATTA
jgi:hypothetical protein